MSTVTGAAAGGPKVRLLWLRIAGLVFLGALMMLALAAVDAGDEGTSRLSPAVAAGAAAAIFAAVASRIYVLIRRSGHSRRDALLIALGVLPASYAGAILILWVVVTVSS